MPANYQSTAQANIWGRRPSIQTNISKLIISELVSASAATVPLFLFHHILDILLKHQWFFYTWVSQGTGLLPWPTQVKKPFWPVFCHISSIYRVVYLIKTLTFNTFLIVCLLLGDILQRGRLLQEDAEKNTPEDVSGQHSQG